MAREQLLLPYVSDLGLNSAPVTGMVTLREAVDYGLLSGVVGQQIELRDAVEFGLPKEVAKIALRQEGGDK